MNQIPRHHVASAKNATAGLDLASGGRRQIGLRAADGQAAQK
jgi:hypothetical protein